MAASPGYEATTAADARLSSDQVAHLEGVAQIVFPVCAEPLEALQRCTDGGDGTDARSGSGAGCDAELQAFRACSEMCVTSTMALRRGCGAEMAAFFAAWDAPSVSIGSDKLLSIEYRSADRTDAAAAAAVACHDAQLAALAAESGAVAGSATAGSLEPGARAAFVRSLLAAMKLRARSAGSGSGSATWPLAAPGGAMRTSSEGEGHVLGAEPDAVLYPGYETAAAAMADAGAGDRTVAVLAAAGSEVAVRRVVATMDAALRRNEARPAAVPAAAPRKARSRRMHAAEAAVNAAVLDAVAAINRTAGLRIPSPLVSRPPPRTSKSHRLRTRRANKAATRAAIKQFLQRELT
ncbi:uncharacterized protein AMSG_00241 [Thecamonas trahens ATCC 50062]|uniref:Uncharacterized protein n=1 Tax=Thecamonas trahens ATCC 50062 TaxID=461836 RepID=A0A0L0D4A2_THETB|nr:hypothetical protein AMSG_00241 [Thecamonas trahens ATCC 50062]KNC46123.1 hypothetical protein AMSG_00241 [Thecamonas trahens ATCC 50062]|eukprot:XP_013763100.1 hypothetical protein AMSG_00241 [Thecamonas trahens ATCC 50062]